MPTGSATSPNDRSGKTHLMTDTSKTAYFCKSRLELFGGAATWLPAIGFFYLCVNGTFNDTQKGFLLIPIGWIGLAVAGASLLTLLSDLLVRPALVVSLSPSGLRDWRVSPDEILWTSVLDVRIGDFGKRRAVMIEIDANKMASMQLSWRIRFLRKFGVGGGKETVWIFATWLQTDFTHLHHDLLAYARAHCAHMAASIAKETKSAFAPKAVHSNSEVL